MNNQLKQLEDEIDFIMKEIIVPLRSEKIVDESNFMSFFQTLEVLIVAINNEQEISRKICGSMFYLYTQLEIQLHYANDDQKEPIRKKKTKLLTLMRKVFGDIRENIH